MLFERDLGFSLAHLGFISRIPDPDFSITDPVTKRRRGKSVFIQKTFTKLSEIGFVSEILNPDIEVKKAPDSGYGSSTLLRLNIYEDLFYH
jgi:hypothetical protein